jgi:hypothetical protein
MRNVNEYLNDILIGVIFISSLIKHELAVISGLLIAYIMELNRNNSYDIKFIKIFSLTFLGFFVGMFAYQPLLNLIGDKDLTLFTLFLIGIFFKNIYNAIIDNIDDLLGFIIKKLSNKK